MMKERGFSQRDGSEAIDLPPQAAAFVLRSRIIDAAVREVADRGYADATEADIAERANVPIEVFRQHVASKQDAVILAYDLAAAFAVPRIRDAFRREPDWASGARAALATYVAILDCDRAWTLVCLSEVAKAGPGGRAVRETLREPLIEAFQPPTPMPAATWLPSLISALDAAVVDALRREPSVPLREHQHELTQLVLAPIVGLEPPGAGRRAAASAAAVCAPSTAPIAVEAAADRPDAKEVLSVLVRDAAKRRDGPALWQIIALLRERRAADKPVPRTIERQALDALEDAWPFGLLGSVRA